LTLPDSSRTKTTSAFWTHDFDASCPASVGLVLKTSAAYRPPQVLLRLALSAAVPVSSVSQKHFLFPFVFVSLKAAASQRVESAKAGIEVYGFAMLRTPEPLPFDIPNNIVFPALHAHELPCEAHTVLFDTISGMVSGTLGALTESDPPTHVL
jgi:hypothetical protein